MPARVQVQVEAVDNASGVLRGIFNQFGTLGRVASDYTDVLNKNSSALSLYQKALTDTRIPISAVMQAEDAAAAAGARFYESLVMLAVEGTKKLYELGRAGAELERLSTGGGEAFRQMGGDIEDAARAIEAASLGTISHYDAMASASRAALLGVSADSDQLANLMEIAAFRARAMGMSTTQAFDDITRGIGRNSPLILDNLGIITKGWADEAAAAGVAYDSHFILNKVLEDGNRMLAEAGGLANDNAAAYERLDANIKNVTDQMKIHIAEAIGPAVQGLADLMTQMDEYEQRLTAATGGTMDFSQAGAYAAAQAVMAADATEELSVAIEDQNTALQETVEVINEIDYEKLISSMIDMQDETDRYNEKQADLLAKKDELVAKLAQETAQYGANSKQVQETQRDLDKLTKDLDKNAKQHELWAKQTVFAFAQARAAADGTITSIEGEILVGLGESMGLFSEQTADAMRAVNSAFDDLDAGNAEDVIASVNSAMYALTNKVWTITIVTDASGVWFPSTASGGENTCFVEGTYVLSDGVEIPFEDLKVGDTVLSYDLEKGEIVKAKVKIISRHAPDEMGEYYLLLNNKIGVTPNHQMYVNSEWKDARDIRIGDALQNRDGSMVIVTKIKRVNKRVWTYNLHTDHPSHNYFANGVLVHNMPMKAQSGGTVYAGSPTLIGEGGPEWMMPSVNGRVLSNAESLHALTLGGGGGTNYFYGPVTIEAGSNAGNDLLSVR